MFPSVNRENTKADRPGLRYYCSFVQLLIPLTLISSLCAGEAETLNVAYVSDKEIAIQDSGFSPEGKSVNITLEFAPPPGTELVVVRNISPSTIRGTFSNLAQGQTITLSYGGIPYKFVANYHGGSGNDLVLLWTTNGAIPAPVLAKLDDQIALALKKAAGNPPFDKPTSLAPDIPVSDGNRILVDVAASVSQELLSKIRASGGQIVSSATTPTKLRTMIPLPAISSLASRSDVEFISPATVTVRSRIGAPPP